MKKIQIYIVGIIALVVLAQGAQVALAETADTSQGQFTAVVNKAEVLASYVFTRNLTVGSRGTDVQKLQEFLVSGGYLSIDAPTTYFGVQTRIALAKWQAANGVSPAAGYFGTLTRAKVNTVLAGGTGLPSTGTTYTFTRNLTVGSTGTDVKKLQEFLISGGYLTLASPTTYFGNATKIALAKWQVANSISPAAGYFGTLTRAKVNAQLAGGSGAPSGSFISRPVAVAVGSSVAIRFTSTAQRNVNIYLCKTSSDCRTAIAANVPVVAGENTYTWMVPADVITGAYTIKIEDVANSSWAVYTDVPLTQPTATATSTPPATQPSIGVASFTQRPANTKAGDLITFKFTTKNLRNVSITLCTDSEHCDVVVTPSFAVIDGANTFVWTIPTSTPARSYLVRIKDADNANGAGFMSELFTVAPPPSTAPTITITKPVTTQVGGDLLIKFNSKYIKTANISLCVNASQCNIVVAPSIPVVDGANTYTWEIPTSTAVGQYLVKMKSLDPATSTEFVSSLFALTAMPIEPTIEITKPATTQAGTTLIINYKTTGLRVANAYLCIGIGQCETTIKSGILIPVDGPRSYSWTIPTTAVPAGATSSTYYIGMSGASSTKITYSNAFTVTAAKGTICATVIKEGLDPLVYIPQAVCPAGLEPVLSGSFCDEHIFNWLHFSSADSAKLYSGGVGITCSIYPPGGTKQRVKITCCNP